MHAFEPSSGNLWFIARHLHWNGITNTTVHPYALSSFEGESRFGGCGTSKTYALDGGDECVRVCTGQSLIVGGTRAPTFAKLDVEGAEASVLAGMIGMLRRDTILLIAVHSRAAYDGCEAPNYLSGIVSTGGRSSRRRCGPSPR